MFSNYVFAAVYRSCYIVGCYPRRLEACLKEGGTQKRLLTSPNWRDYHRWGCFARLPPRTGSTWQGASILSRFFFIDCSKRKQEDVKSDRTPIETRVKTDVALGRCNVSVCRPPLPFSLSCKRNTQVSSPQYFSFFLVFSCFMSCVG